MAASRSLFSALFDLLGSRMLVVREDADTFSVATSSLGFVVLMTLVVIGLSLAILVSVWRGGKAGNGGRHRGWKEALAVPWVCLAVIAAIGYSDTRLDARRDSPLLVVEESGITGPLLRSRAAIPIADITDIDVGHVTVKAPTRNGTPQGPDEDGYYLRIRGKGGVEITGPGGEVADTRRTIAAARALLAFLARHPDRPARPIGSNIHRYAKE